MNELQAPVACDALQLIHALMHSGKQIEARLDTALAAVGLSAAKWGALRVLSEAGEPMPLGQLAERLSCVKSNATQLVDRLEAEQLVSRVPDPEDRRSIRAELTAEGRQRFTVGHKVVASFEREMLSGYTDDERRILDSLLTRLRN